MSSADLPSSNRRRSKGRPRGLGALAVALYRSITSLAAPLSRALLRRRLARDKEDPARVAERLGRASLPRPAGPLVWLHAASVGESLSILPLVEALIARHTALNVLVTTGTRTSATLMAERLPPAVIHQYAVVDVPEAVERFLDHWRPDLLILVESEIWPNVIETAAARGLQLALVNARLSGRSFARWRLVRPVIAQLLSRFDLVLAQSPRDAARLRRLGALRARALGNLKHAAAPLAVDELELARLRALLEGRPVWVAASTHEGEEAIVAEIHEALLERWPDLLTILVPRHPERGSEIAQALAARGHSVSRRSQGEVPQGSLYLADTLGELGLWYRLAEVAFIGGSLVDKGGHNPLEPARLACPVLIGPHTEAFAAIVKTMKAAEALRQAADGPGLEREVARLLSQETLRRALGEAGARYAASEADVLGRVLAELEPLLARLLESASAPGPEPAEPEQPQELSRHGEGQTLPTS